MSLKDTLVYCVEAGTGVLPLYLGHCAPRLAIKYNGICVPAYPGSPVKTVVKWYFFDYYEITSTEFKHPEQYFAVRLEEDANLLIGFLIDRDSLKREWKWFYH